LAQPSVKSGDVALRHRPQRDEGPQIAFRRRYKFSSGFLELIDEQICFLTTRRFAVSKNKEVAELESAIDARGGHCGFQARLERGCVRMAKNAKAVLLLAVALVVEREREPAMQRWPFLVGIALNSNVDIIGEVEVLLLQPQHFVEKIAEPIFLVLIKQTDDVGGLQLAFEGLVDPRCLFRLLWSGAYLHKGKALRDFSLGHATLAMFLAGLSSCRGE
jgi:hypothetical protein